MRPVINRLASADDGLVSTLKLQPKAGFERQASRSFQSRNGAMMTRRWPRISVVGISASSCPSRTSTR
jgi:hypothetical protein